jgi:ABC-type transport system involved in multi-copper enzyme maturation permease subunit
VALLVCTIITASFIPNLLRKGSVDLLISKPIHRTSLLLYKYVGGLSFMFLNTVFVVIGIWLVLGLRSNLWAPAFLLSIVILTFQFALYYAVSTLFGVLTRSPLVAILMTCLTWFVLFAATSGYRYLEGKRDAPGPERAFPEWVFEAAKDIHYVLPRMKDLDLLTNQLIVTQLLPQESEVRRESEKEYASFNWGESITVSCLYIAALLGLACWRFAAKDY